MRYAITALILIPLFSFAADPPPTTTQELIRTLREGVNFKPYTNKAAWQKRAAYLRQQVLISAGLWPMPEKCPLNAVIHGRIDRDGYTIEKVYFQSYPGFYVTGNLYRPTGKTGPFPAILSPHGHWKDGRLYETPDAEVKNQLAGGWEKDTDAARYPLQARCATLARLGCIVFFYDMVGYADADPVHFPHRQIYRDVDSDLRGLSVFGLQTWDSIRSLDFLESLPEVDKARIAITGASGGGSQSLMMMAVDDRLAAAAPVCMISGDYQGGCVCENNSLLRIGTDNIELAATFAPKPFIHPTATGDWTKNYLEHGFPEIQATYKLFDAEGNVESIRQTAPHNYNLHAREAVYNFFNKHLKLGHEGVIAEPKFTPVLPKDLHVWDEGHPRPKDSVDAAGLKKWWVEMTGRQIERMKPKDAESLSRFQAVIRPALAHMLATDMPKRREVIVGNHSIAERHLFSVETLTLRRASDARAVSAVQIISVNPRPPTTIVIFPEGKRAAFQSDGSLHPLIAKLAQRGFVLVPDLYGTGEIEGAGPVTTQPTTEFFTGYNRTTMGNRVHDILTAVGWKHDFEDPAAIDLVGVGSAGPWCLLARSMAGGSIRAVVVDARYFDSTVAGNGADLNDLPMLLRYDGPWPLASLGGSGPMFLHHVRDNQPLSWIKTTYELAGVSDKLHLEHGDPNPNDIVRWLLKR